MKVEVQTEKKFNPVIMQITFESQDEIDILKHMLGFNVTVPDAIYHPDRYPEKNEKLHYLMNQIRKYLS